MGAVTDQANGHPGPVQLPAYDPANPLMQQAAQALPSLLTSETVTTQQGQMMRLAIRTPDTTLVVLLRREDVNAWGLWLCEQAAGMSGLIVPPGLIPPASGPQGGA